MMKKCVTIYIFAATLLIVTNTVFAQITISQSDLQNLIGQTYDVKAYVSNTASDFTALAAQTGANQTFDFSTIASFSEDYTGKIDYIALPATIPGSGNPNFQNATFAIGINLTSTGQASDSTAWVYERVTSDSASFAGVVFVSQSDLNNDGISPDTLTINYKPYLLNAKLPLTYQTSWKDTASYSLSIGGSISITRTVQTDAIVDGYGTLKTPNGSFDCLRLKRTTTMITDIGGIKTTTTSGSIDFVTKTGSAIAASIQLDASGNPISAQYTESGTSTPIEQPPVTGTITQYKLRQNYPNPFNPTTVISYDLKSAGLVKLQVFNSIGRKVATLVNSNQAAGSHQVTFDAHGLNSGIYFYKLQSGNFSQIKKMILLK